MLLGIKSWKTIFSRYLLVGSLAILLVGLISWSRLELPLVVNFWRALGDSATVFLFITLSLGPLSRLWPKAQRWLSWRREAGVWFALLSLAHFSQVNDFAETLSGSTLAVWLGLTALFWAFLLAITSSDWAVNWLGLSSWKWLHQGAYIIFYLVAFHVSYFLFFRSSEINNWWRWPFALMMILVLILQLAAFVKTVIQQKSKSWY